MPDLVQRVLACVLQLRHDVCPQYSYHTTTASLHGGECADDGGNNCNGYGLLGTVILIHL
jgi:hypothetical protein